MNGPPEATESAAHFLLSQSLLVLRRPSFVSAIITCTRIKSSKMTDYLATLLRTSLSLSIEQWVSKESNIPSLAIAELLLVKVAFGIGTSHCF